VNTGRKERGGAISSRKKTGMRSGCVLIRRSRSRNPGGLGTTSGKGDKGAMDLSKGGRDPRTTSICKRAGRRRTKLGRGSADGNGWKDDLLSRWGQENRKGTRDGLGTGGHQRTEKNEKKRSYSGSGVGKVRGRRGETSQRLGQAICPRGEETYSGLARKGWRKPRISCKEDNVAVGTGGGESP